MNVLKWYLLKHFWEEIMNDPYVDEIRKYRMAHTHAFNGDIHRIGEDLRSFESTLGSRVVSLEPKRLRQQPAIRVCLTHNGSNVGEL